GVIVKAIAPKNAPGYLASIADSVPKADAGMAAIMHDEVDEPAAAPDEEDAPRPGELVGHIAEGVGIRDFEAPQPVPRAAAVDAAVDRGAFLRVLAHDDGGIGGAIEFADENGIGKGAGGGDFGSRKI